MYRKIEQSIHDMKKLRRIYELITEASPTLDIEYEGSVRALGDTVSIRPRAVLSGNIQPLRPLCIDTLLPKSGTLQAILNIVDWEADGDIVIALVGGDFMMGYRRYGRI